MRVAFLALMLPLLLPIVQLQGAPIRADVPIYVPANLPVSGQVCLPSPLAAGLTAKLYVDGEFFQEGRANETGCYTITIRPLSPGRHELRAEIFATGVKVAEITAEVIAIEGMLLLRPDPLGEVELGTESEVRFFLENRSPVNLTDVWVEVEAPFPIYGHGMSRVAVRPSQFVIRGRIGDVAANSSKQIVLLVKASKRFKPGEYWLNFDVRYRVGESVYEVPLAGRIVLKPPEGAKMPSPPTVESPQVRTSEIVGIPPPPDLGLIVILVAISAIALASMLLIMRRFG